MTRMGVPWIDIGDLLLHWRATAALEQLQPFQGDRVGNRGSCAVLFRRFPPVEADPAGGVRLGIVDESGQFVWRALEREHLFDHHGFADADANELGLSGWE